MSEIIFGRNSVYEYLNNSKDFEKLLIQNSLDLKKFDKIISLCKKNNIPIDSVDKSKLDKITNSANHQGLVLYIKPYNYYSLGELINYADKSNPLLVILDEITDPHNLGAIIRTSEAVGADGVIIPKHRAAEVNATVHKTSAGATAFMKVARVTNINQTIETLKEQGYWVYGADGHTDTYYTEIDYSGKVALVIGNEGRGISKKTKEKCDQLIKIPMLGKTESLNASTSAAILMYGILQKRNNKF